MRPQWLLFPLQPTTCLVNQVIQSCNLDTACSLLEVTVHIMPHTMRGSAAVSIPMYAAPAVRPLNYFSPSGTRQSSAPPPNPSCGTAEAT